MNDQMFLKWVKGWDSILSRTAKRHQDFDYIMSTMKSRGHRLESIENSLQRNLEVLESVAEASLSKVSEDGPVTLERIREDILLRDFIEEQTEYLRYLTRTCKPLEPIVEYYSILSSTNDFPACEISWRFHQGFIRSRFEWNHTGEASDLLAESAERVKRFLNVKDVKNENFLERILPDILMTLLNSQVQIPKTMNTAFHSSGWWESTITQYVHEKTVI